MKTLSGRLGGLLACGAILAAVAVAAPAQAQDKKPISVLLPNENTTTLFPNIVARELGFFEDEGLDVTLLASDTTIPYVAFLVNSQADLVMLDAPQTFQAVRAQQPVKVVFEGMQYAPEVLIVRDDSPIQSVADLKGKTIGLASDRDQITAQVALDTAGITIDEVSTVVVGDSGPVLARAVRDSEVDVVAAAANDMTVLEANDIPSRDITPPEVSENPANSFVIAESRIEELRPTVTAFLRAWAKGAEAAKIDRDAVAAMARQSVPEEWEAEAGGQALLDASMKMILPQTPKHGQPQPDVWAGIQGPYIKFGVIDGEIDPATFIDDSFYEAANDFDPAEVKAAIEAWKAANPDLLQP
jgi:NitT/TauT family transport system substrate-binding protein